MSGANNRFKVDNGLVASGNAIFYDRVDVQANAFFNNDLFVVSGNLVVNGSLVYANVTIGQGGVLLIADQQPLGNSSNRFNAFLFDTTSYGTLKPAANGGALGTATERFQIFANNITVTNTVNFPSGAGVNSSLYTGTASNANTVYNISSNGIVVRTGTGTGNTVSIASTNGISVTNGDGTTGNPTITFANGAGLFSNSLGVQIDLGGITTGVLSVARGGTGGNVNNLLPTQTLSTAGYVLSSNGSDGVLYWSQLAGPQGPQGVTGSNGAIGLTGAQGPQGPQGAVGFTGSLGAQGATGPQGATGAQGAVGFTGSRGDTGFTGSASTVAGPQGPQGTGLTGFTGSRGNTGFTGSASTVVGFTGSRGAQGVTGAQGAQGTVGFTGSLGTTGAQGTVGFTGSRGAQGVTGAQGAQGAQGVVGYTGSRGAQGPQGPQGTSVTGAQGPQGPQGSAADATAPILRHVTAGFTGGGQVFVTNTTPRAIQAGTGTITTATNSTTVTGTSTIFDSTYLNNTLFAPGNVALGTVSSVTTNTALTLTSNALFAVTGNTHTYGIISALTAGDIWIDTVGTSGYTQSLASSGYTKLPNGLYFQWGSVSRSSMGYSTVSLPISFSSGAYQVIASIQSGGPDNGDEQDEYIYAAPASASTVAVYVNNGSGDQDMTTVTISFFAIGS